MRPLIYTLFNGTQVKECDFVYFTNSDGEWCCDKIRLRPDGTLWFWNIGYDITAYENAVKL